MAKCGDWSLAFIVELQRVLKDLELARLLLAGERQVHVFNLIYILFWFAPYTHAILPNSIPVPNLIAKVVGGGGGAALYRCFQLDCLSCTAGGLRVTSRTKVAWTMFRSYLPVSCYLNRLWERQRGTDGRLVKFHTCKSTQQISIECILKIDVTGNLTRPI